MCSILGHSDKDCVVVYANPERDVEKAYGPWLRAPTRNAKVNTGAKWLRNPVMEDSNSMGYGGSQAFRPTVRNANLGANFEEVDGMLREKSGNQIGIKVISRNQGNMKDMENQITEGEAGMDELAGNKETVVVESIYSKFVLALGFPKDLNYPSTKSSSH